MKLNSFSTTSRIGNCSTLLLALVASAALGSTHAAPAAESAEKGKKAKAATQAAANAVPQASMVQVVDGVVKPRQSLAEAIRDAIHFLRKADGGYVPGNIKG